MSVAVNAQEPIEAAAPAAARLGLRVPIGTYDDALDGAFGVRQLQGEWWDMASSLAVQPQVGK